MTTFEKELKKMFGSCDFITDQTYSGKTMLGRLDDDLRIKISFVTAGYRGIERKRSICYKRLYIIRQSPSLKYLHVRSRKEDEALAVPSEKAVRK